MFTLLYPALLLLLIPAALALHLWRLPTRLLRLLRALLYLLLIMALAQPNLMLRRGGGSVVVLADRSASLPAGTAARQETLIRQLQGRRRVDDQLGVISFGSRAAIEHPLQQGVFSGFTVTHDPDASNLDEALQRALALIPANTPARLLLLSDGRHTGNDPRATAALAATRNIALDYRLMSRHSGHDLAIETLEAPQELRPGEPLLATAWIDAPAAQTVSYTLRRGTTIVARGHHAVPRGRSPLLFRDRPETAAGTVHGYRLDIAGESGPDPIPENNSARFLVSIASEKPLLCIPAAPDSHLPQLLTANGLKLHTIAPEELDATVAALAGYSGIIIENCRAELLGTGAMQTLAAWVEHAAAGLLMTGGRNSFGLGGYYRSPLEALLPVSLELRREHRKFSMAIAVALDRSGSMAMPVAGGRSKMDLANLGTVEVLRLLGDYDEMAVLAVDTQPHIIVPRMPAAQMRRQESRILGIQSMGGGIYVYEALKAAVAQLTGSQAGVRHIVLFSDAADSEEPGNYKELLAATAAAGITVSVIGLGLPGDCDAPLLEDIAARGGGRIFFTNDALEVPRLFAQDTFMVARNTWLTNAVTPQFTVALRELSPTLPTTAPPLGGYNLCYLKPEATLVALSPDEHEAPLLALGRHGTGRVVAFTGEADGADSGPFAQWSSAGEFYTALARYTAGPEGELGEGLLLEQRQVPGAIRLTLHVDPKRPELQQLEGVSATILRHRAGDTPRAERLPLTWQRADSLSAEVPLSGSETLLATVTLPAGDSFSLPPITLPYSPEFAPDPGGQGAAQLAELARLSGGQALADVGEIWQLLPRGLRPLPLATWLYLLAALLFLTEIFERRTAWFSGRRRTATPRRASDSKRESARPSPRRRGRTKPREELPTPADTSVPEPAPESPESPLSRAKRRARDRTRGSL